MKKKGLLAAGVHRLMLDLGEAGLPEVPCVGVHELPRSSVGLREHLHPGAMEICFLVRGEQTYAVGETDYRLRGDDVLVTFPDEHHGTGRNPMGKGLLYWMQVRLPRGNESFLLLQGRKAQPLVRALRQLPRRYFHGTEEMRELFEKIVVAGRETGGGLRQIRLATLLLAYLQAVVECAQRSPWSMYTADILRVLERMEGELEGDLSVSEMAVVAGLSAPRFKAKFKAQVGIPPREYFMRAKIKLAQEMLRTENKSVTAVAAGLGFSSSQYFATVFRRFTNQRASEVRHPPSPEATQPGDAGKRRRALVW